MLLWLQYKVEGADSYRDPNFPEVKEWSTIHVQSRVIGLRVGDFSEWSSEEVLGVRYLDWYNLYLMEKNFKGENAGKSSRFVH